MKTVTRKNGLVYIVTQCDDGSFFKKTVCLPIKMTDEEVLIAYGK